MRTNLNVQQRLDVLEIRVVGAVQRLQTFLRKGNLINERIWR